VTGADTAVRCLVSGIVQGVFFRASTARQADRLGLSGWARNLADGNVEVVARGPEEAVGELTRWLWDGPDAARVDAVSIEVWNEPVESGFRTF
jgi:acylphosphatase